MTGIERHWAEEYELYIQGLEKRLAQVDAETGWMRQQVYMHRGYLQQNKALNNLLGGNLGQGISGSMTPEQNWCRELIEQFMYRSADEVDKWSKSFGEASRLLANLEEADDKRDADMRSLRRELCRAR